MRRAAILGLALPLTACGTYYVDCPDWVEPALVVRTDDGFYDLKGKHRDSSVPEQCDYAKIFDWNPPS